MKLLDGFYLLLGLFCLLLAAIFCPIVWVKLLLFGLLFCLIALAPL